MTLTFDPTEQAHGVRIRALARALCEALPGSWRASVRADLERCVYLTRADGLRLTLYWDRGESRAEIAPSPPEIPGESRPHTGIRATFDPSRPAARIAADIQRRVVAEWDPQLAALNERYTRTLQARADASQRLQQLGRILHTDEAELARVLRHVEGGNDAALRLGTVSGAIDGEVTVSTYRQRTEFKIRVHDPRAALVIARTLAAELARTQQHQQHRQHQGAA